MSKKIPVEKSDIVTLNFFIIANESQRSRKENSDEFIKSTNALLRSCDFFELYYLNPFDCFVMLCLWTEDPFGTYSDVWEYECLPDAPEAKDV